MSTGQARLAARLSLPTASQAKLSFLAEREVCRRFNALTIRKYFLAYFLRTVNTCKNRLASLLIIKLSASSAALLLGLHFDPEDGGGISREGGALS